MMASPVLEIHDLDVRFSTADGEVHAVKIASFFVDESECLGVVGETGSGKSQLFLAAMGLLAANGRASGSVKFRGVEILGLPSKKLNTLRGSKITMIFQDPLTSLTPHLRIGDQIAEALRTHHRMARAEVERRTIAALDLVRIADACPPMRQFPNEPSS